MASQPRVLVPRGQPEKKERIASEAITPGMLLEPDTAGGVRRSRFPDTWNVSPPTRLFAMEKAGLIDPDRGYVAGEICSVAHLVYGDEIYALLAPGAEAVIVRDLLISNGDGCLRKLPAELGSTPYPHVVGRALEAIDNHLGMTTVRILVEITAPTFGE